VLYNGRVSLCSVTGYNELHNGFFKTLGERDQRWERQR